jgi:hypothetical protein
MDYEIQLIVEQILDKRLGEIYLRLAKLEEEVYNLKKREGSKLSTDETH